jgi:hypothetical protein
MASGRREEFSVYAVRRYVLQAEIGAGSVATVHLARLRGPDGFARTVAVGDIHLPRNDSEGDIPLTAISTGAVDSIECVSLKMGVDETEFSGTETGTSGGRIHLVHELRSDQVGLLGR